MPDKNEQELIDKVGHLVRKNFAGNYMTAFGHYDADRDGSIDADELSHLLKDAGVGNFATRGAWVQGIFDKIDRNRDRRITWLEFDFFAKTS